MREQPIETCGVRGALLLAAGVLATAAPLAAWMINEDYQQRDNRAASDFHIILAGDVKDRITGGGTTGVTNPFADPKVTITKTAIGNTEIKFEGSNTIPKDLTANRHFGLFGTGAKPQVRLKSWSYPTAPFIVPVPKSNFAFNYDPSNGQLAIRVENISDDTVTFADVGFLLFASEQPIASLTREVLPPEAFNPLPSLNREYLVGEAGQMVIPNVPSSAYVVTYGTVFFSGSSAGNAYNSEGLGTGGEWTQVAVIDEIPEPATAALMLAGGVIMWMRRRRLPVPMLLVAIALCGPVPGYAWERGNHAGRWAKGATVKIKVDVPPGNAAQQLAYYEALSEAIAEWNTAQAEFGGLKLETTTEGAGDIAISWHDNTDAATLPGGPPVRIRMGYARTDGGAGNLNSRAITRILKHELGHAEGLGHSARSALMRADAYSSNPGKPPSDADLESANPFTDPTADDKAGKKAMYGTAERLNRGDAQSNALFDGTQWNYQYALQGLVGPGLVNPITELTLSLPLGVDPSVFSVTQLPPGWEHTFHSALVDPGGRFDDGEPAVPSYLTFSAMSPGAGILPGSSAFFALSSLLSPGEMRAFTNSPSYDSDEFMLAVPVPEPTTLALLALAPPALRRRPPARRA